MVKKVMRMFHGYSAKGAWKILDVMKEVDKRSAGKMDFLVSYHSLGAGRNKRELKQKEFDRLIKEVE